MKDAIGIFKQLVWVTQLGLSAVAPVTLCIWGSVWLRQRFALGSWIVVLGVLAGLGGSVCALRSSLKGIKRLGEETDKKDPGVAFNDHK